MCTADHVSGNQELKSRTGAAIYFNENAPVNFEHQKLKEGDIIEFGMVKLEILYTPGHTPNSLSILVTDKARAELPWMILTGDLLFVGSIGRPDLAGAEILEEQVHNLYDSLYEKLQRLPDYLEVFPAHGQGSLCGKGLSAKASSTLGYERLTQPVLGLEGFDAFHDQIAGAFSRSSLKVLPILSIPIYRGRPCSSAAPWSRRSIRISSTNFAGRGPR